MNAPGKTLLKTACILYIASGCIGILGVFLLMISTMIQSSDFWYLFYLIDILLFIVPLVIGKLGLDRYDDPESANFFIISGAVFCTLSALDILLRIVLNRFSIFHLVGFILPILFIIGGTSNKNAPQPQPDKPVTVEDLFTRHES